MPTSSQRVVMLASPVPRLRIAIAMAPPPNGRIQVSSSPCLPLLPISSISGSFQWPTSAHGARSTSVSHPILKPIFRDYGLFFLPDQSQGGVFGREHQRQPHSCALVS